MKKPTVLIVDDDKFLLDMYRKKFENHGALVDVAINAEEVLAKLRNGDKPEILILDVIIPGMDGIELLETIRKEKLVADSIIIMLTNESDPDKMKKAKALGVKGYIIKASSTPTEVVRKVWEIADLKIN